MLELVAHRKLRGRLSIYAMRLVALIVWIAEISQGDFALRPPIVTASEGMGIAPEVKLLVDVNACML